MAAPGLGASWEDVWITTGIRLAVTPARELKRSGTRYGIASACIGGGQGIALSIENPDATAASRRRKS